VVRQRKNASWSAPGGRLYMTVSLIMTAPSTE
jgi:hypothetical protein